MLNIHVPHNAVNNKLYLFQPISMGNFHSKIWLCSSVAIFFVLQLSEYELTVATDIVDPLTLPISWKDIGGLREVIDEIKVRMNLKIPRCKVENKIKKVCLNSLYCIVLYLLC